MENWLPGSLISLRPPEKKDYPALGKILNDKITMQALVDYFKTDTWSEKDVEKRYETIFKNRQEGTGLSYAVLLNATNEVVGSCGFKNIDYSKKQAEFGIILDKSTWGKKISTECHLLCLEHGFQVLKFTKVYFTTSVHNNRMKGFFLKHHIVPVSGFTPGGSVRYDLKVSQWPQVRESLLKERVAPESGKRKHT